MGNMTNIVTITQIPNNQYGYKIQLLDIDGSPLNDVVIKGIDDPSTEIRTNAEGIVQFYSNKSSFTGLTYEGFPGHLDASMFPKTMQGYINDTNVVIVNPDTSRYYGYDIAITDNSGNILANHPVYSVNNNMTDLGMTDSTGHLIVYRDGPSMEIAVKNNAYYTKSTVSGTLGSLKTNSIKTDMVAYTGTLAVGNTITCMGISMIVCHQDGNRYYLAFSNLSSMTEFGSNSTYSGSNLASVVSRSAANIANREPIIMGLYFINTTVHDVTAKMFVASYDQMNGGFSYFNSNSRRVCKYNGTAQYYWTSSPHSGTNTVQLVGFDGSIGEYDGRPSSANGVRFFACLSL